MAVPSGARFVQQVQELCLHFRPLAAAQAVHHGVADGAVAAQGVAADHTVFARAQALNGGLCEYDACIDATVAGLLAARERIASELLAEFESQAATRRAELAP